MSNAIVDKIRNANTFLILTHRRPDGDAISSALAIYWYLISIKKLPQNIDIVIPNYAEELSFIFGNVAPLKEPFLINYDLAIIVDSAEFNFIKGKEYLKLAKESICIDHHAKKEYYADYNCVEVDASSCTCVIYKLFHECNNLYFLRCIGIGILSDTNNLVLNTTFEAKNILNELTMKGVDIGFISNCLSMISERTKQLIDLVIKRGKFYNNKIWCSYILQKDLYPKEKSLELINIKLIIQEVQKKINYETLVLICEKENGELKASMRTFNSSVNLLKICNKLLTEGKAVKGGGHAYSVGLTMVGNCDNLFKIVTSELEKYN